MSVGASQGSEEEEKQLGETSSACRGVGHAHTGEKTLRVTLQPPLPRQKAKASSRDAGGGWERGSQRPRQSIAEIRGRNCLSRGLCSTKRSRTPPPPHSPHHRQKIRLNPSFVFLIILNLCHKARGPGAVYLHPPRYLFGNNIMFSLKQVLSPRRVPACARVCVLPELRFTFPDGWMGIQSPFFKVVHKMYLLFFISYLSQGVICFHSEK